MAWWAWLLVAGGAVAGIGIALKVRTRWIMNHWETG